MWIQSMIRPHNDPPFTYAEELFATKSRLAVGGDQVKCLA